MLNARFTWLESIRSVVQKSRAFDCDVLQVCSVRQDAQADSRPSGFAAPDANVVFVRTRVFEFSRPLGAAGRYIGVVFVAADVTENKRKQASRKTQKYGCTEHLKDSTAH